MASGGIARPGVDLVRSFRVERAVLQTDQRVRTEKTYAPDPPFERPTRAESVAPRPRSAVADARLKRREDRFAAKQGLRGRVVIDRAGLHGMKIAEPADFPAEAIFLDGGTRYEDGEEKVVRRGAPRLRFASPGHDGRFARR